MDGDGTGTAQSNLTFDGADLDVTGNVQISGELDVDGDFLGATTFSTRFHENYNNIGNSTGGTTIDLSTANNFRIDRIGSITIALSNAPSAPRAIGFTLLLEDSSGGTATVSWPASIQWANGAAPTLTAGGKDILVFYTYDGGSTYYGFLSANNIS
jgi:hypothetical protein